MKRIEYRGWPNCYQLANGHIEIIVTGDVGPRVVHLSIMHEDNLFAVLPEQAGLTGGHEWRIYGGHRLWHAPQAKPRSELPDNSPVEVHIEDQAVHLIPPVEAASGVRKEIGVALIDDQPRAVVRHVLTNTTLWPIELAPWALSVMNIDGLAIVPHSTLHTTDDVLPNRLFTFWPFADPSDPRLHLGKAYTLLHQDPQNEQPFKLGMNGTAGWAAYYRRGQLFIKCFCYDAFGRYPDAGCSVELFDSARFLELETVAPLARLEPGASVEHVEHWFVYRVQPVTSEQAVDDIVRPLAEQAVAKMEQTVT
jgi:hypothetical protein